MKRLLLLLLLLAVRLSPGVLLWSGLDRCDSQLAHSCCCATDAISKELEDNIGV
jgi:hypothetical protein